MPYGPDKPRLAKSLRILRENPWLQQFGQPADYSAFGGATACTHVVLQALALVWKGKRLTIDQISTLAGYDRERNSEGFIRGMNNTEFATVCAKLGLPYSIVFGLSASDMVRYSNRGPVFYGMRYGSHPDWRGYVYDGVTAKSPYAIKGGATQLTGFENGRHAVLLAGYRTMVDATGTVVGYRAWVKDPNHGSGSRPERPGYDEITVAQAKREYTAYLQAGAANTYAAIPRINLPT